MALGLQWRVVLVDGEQKRVEKVMRMSGNDDKAPLKAVCPPSSSFIFTCGADTVQIKQRMDEQQTWTTGLLKMWTAMYIISLSLSYLIPH